MMTVGVEMQHYHTEPKLLRVGDDNLCTISLGKEDEEFADTLRMAVALTSSAALLRAAEDEDELELNYEENDNNMDVDTAQRNAADSLVKGKAVASAKHKKQQPGGRSSRSSGATRNRSKSKPRLPGTRDSDNEWETDDEAAQPSGNSHQ
eukprot:jgi/Tetstr1/425164/TSEL_015625.t1